MADWRKKARRKAQEREDKARRTQEEEVRRRELRERRASERELAKKVARLGRKFKCHICGVSSKEPARWTTTSWSYSDFPPGGSRSDVDHVDYDKPGDLFECNDCGRLTCSDCMEAGMCRKCAEGGILWRWFRVG